MRVVVGISGASGAILAVRLLQALQDFSAVETHVVISERGRQTLEYETGLSEEAVLSLANHSYAADDLFAPIASGSFEVAGMVVCPCSMKTLAAVCCGYSDNLLQRAVDVCLKENKRVVLVPREMPLGKVHLHNLNTAAEFGCTIIPPVLTFYHHPKQVDDHINQILGKILAQFDLRYRHYQPWEGK